MNLTQAERSLIVDALQAKAVRLREEATAEATRVKKWDNEWTTSLCERAREIDTLVGKINAG